MNISHQYKLENYGKITEQEKIVCPYCFDERETGWDDTEGVPYESREYQCEKCDKYFEVDCEPDTTFYYTSKRVSQGEGYGHRAN